MTTTPPPTDTSGIPPRIASLLCYLLMLFTLGLPVSGVIFTVIEKRDALIRFHAWQSIVLGATAWVATIGLGVLSTIVSAWLGMFDWLMHIAHWLLMASVFTTWVLCLLKSYQGEAWEIPVLGAWAQQLARRS